MSSSILFVLFYLNGRIPVCSSVSETFSQHTTCLLLRASCYFPKIKKSFKFYYINKSAKQHCKGNVANIKVSVEYKIWKKYLL